MNRLLGRLLLVVALSVAPVAAQAQFMDVNSIVAGIGGRDFLTAVERLDSSADVRVVRLSTLNGAELYRERLARAVASKPRDIYHLQSSIRLNPMAIWAVRNAGTSIEQIVALQASGDGAVILFADDL
ncbi:MAG TPA: hypothetical protein VGN80_03245 [Devosiaceae bacterium]|jgi:hypothetical protein|nr:hypothetical protein [Devosiaceae bacterium]